MGLGKDDHGLGRTITASEMMITGLVKDDRGAIEETTIGLRKEERSALA
jgi:hypothetical protein